MEYYNGKKYLQKCIFITVKINTGNLEMKKYLVCHDTRN